MAALAPFVLAALGVAAPLSAAPPQEASGTSTRLTAAVVDVREADGNTVITQVNTGVMTGTFAGTFVAEARVVIHPSGLVTVSVTRTCTCTVEGRAGIVVFRFAVVGEASAPPVFDIRGATISATGGLEGLHAVLRERQIGASGEYSGSFHFDP